MHAHRRLRPNNNINVAFPPLSTTCLVVLKSQVRNQEEAINLHLILIFVTTSEEKEIYLVPYIYLKCVESAKLGGIENSQIPHPYKITKKKKEYVKEKSNKENDC